MKKPNTFIVGKPKSGTSALHFFLEKHPEVFMCNPKEPRYFCSDFIKQSNDHYGKRDPYFYFQTQEEYLKLFEDAKDEKIVGEGSVIYMYSKESEQRIYDFNKDAKIIIMIREPVDFLYALHSEIVVTGKENEEDFKAALSLEDERKSGKNLPKRVRFPGMVYYSERMRIADQLQRGRTFLRNQFFS